MGPGSVRHGTICQIDVFENAERRCTPENFDMELEPKGTQRRLRPLPKLALGPLERNWHGEPIGAPHIHASHVAALGGRPCAGTARASTARSVRSPAPEVSRLTRSSPREPSIRYQTLNDVPQPHVLLAFGFRNSSV